MAIDKETQINASAILDKTVHAKLKEIAKENKRSISKQMAYIIEEYIKNYPDKK